MKKLLILVNKLIEFTSMDYVNEYFEDISVSISEFVPEDPNEYDLILLWNYKKILPNIGRYGNVVVFHSSALPRGKGWAPIYYTIANEEEYYTITGILAVNEVDAGDILVRASFKMCVNYTASVLRQWDNIIMLLLARELLSKSSKPFKGIAQTGEGSSNPRRHPEDSEIELSVPFGSIVNHLRACEEAYPAFFYYKGKKFYVNIEPEEKPVFPDDLKIEFFC